jgi:hypothetical protein
MKSKVRIQRNGKLGTSRRQIKDRPQQHRRLNGAGEPAPEREMTPAELLEWKERRGYKLSRPVQVYIGDLNIEEDNDLVIAWVLAENISLSMPELVTHVLPGLDSRKAAHFCMQIMFAKKVASNSDRILAAPFPPEAKRAVNLPGLSGMCEFTLDTILFHLASTLNDHREIIRTCILSTMTGLDKVLFAEALALAQSVMDKFASDEEIEAWQYHGGPAPAAFQDAWQTKADYYRSELQREANSALEVYAKMKAADKKMLSSRMVA